MTGSPEEWVGYFKTRELAEFVKLTGRISVPGTVGLDVPNRRTFGLPMTLSGDPEDQVYGSAGFFGETAQLAGKSDGQIFAGRLAVGDSEGTFELRRVAVWDIRRYRKLSAAYAVADGRRISIFVNADDWVGAPTMVYSENDRMVRLYPDSSGALISEAGEAFTLAADKAGLDAVRPLIRVDDTPAMAIGRVAAWEDEDITITGPAGVLGGTLMKPPGPGPHPAIVLIHGAAGGRRDLYRAYAEHFIQAGLAALVYDKRGNGESAGNAEPELTFEEKSFDAEAWVDYLQSRPDIRSDRVGVWGISNGSWVAPMVAARRPDVAFVAVVGASGTTAIETEIHRRAFDLREQDVPHEQVEQVAELWRLIYKLLVSRQPDAEHAERFDHLTKLVQASGVLARVRLQQYAIDEPFLGPIPPYQSYQQVIDELPQNSDTDEWTCDPADYYKVISAPVLFLVGDHDSNLPALRSAQRISKTLHDAGNYRGTILLFPNTGHMMNVVEPGSDTGMTSEEAGYRFHHFRFAGGFVDIVRSWATAQAFA